MPWYTLVSLILTALSIPTIFGLWWKDLHERRKQNSAESKRKRKEEERNNLREIIRSETSELTNELKQINKKIDKISDGTLSTLRNDILTYYYKCVDKGYRNDYDYTNIHDLYEAYVGLNGNSFVEDVMHRFDALPTKEEYMGLIDNANIVNKNTRVKKGDGANG